MIFLRKNYKQVIFIGIGILLFILVLNRSRTDGVTTYDLVLFLVILHYYAFLLLNVLEFIFYFIRRIIRRKKIDSKEGDKLGFSGTETQSLPKEQTEIESKK